MSGWIGMDLDGTLAEYHGFQGPNHIGPPIPAMVARVIYWIAAGVEVRIFTARVWPGGQDGRDLEAVRSAIQAWCEEHVGMVLPVTHEKDWSMWFLYDDRAVQVERNTGRLVGGGEAETMLAKRSQE